MESSPFFSPAFIVTLIIAAIGFVAWLIRLEGKATAALTANSKLETETSLLWAEHERHKENQDIHFNQRVSSAIEAGNTRRFETIERQLGEINRKLDGLTGSKP